MVLQSDKYPKDSLFKIHQRLGNVYIQLGEARKSIDQFQKAIKFVEKANLPNDQKSKVIEEINHSLKIAKNMPISSKKASFIGEHLDIECEHEQFSNVSKKLEVQYSKEKGRYSIGK